LETEYFKLLWLESICFLIIFLASGIRQLVACTGLKMSLAVSPCHSCFSSTVPSAVCLQHSAGLTFPPLPIRDNHCNHIMDSYVSPEFQYLFLYNCVDTYQVKYSLIQLLAYLSRIPHMHVLLLLFYH
jgi:hypothetical protein